MKFKLLSDLHTEFWRGDGLEFTYNGEDVLVLAGDIAVGADAVFLEIEYFLKLGLPHIVYTPGNHDYWGSHMHQFEDNLTEQCKNLPVTLLFGRGERVTIKDVTFFGGTLWTDFDNRNWFAMQAAKSMINDYRRIRNYSVENTVRLNDQHVSNIKFLYENTPGKKVIVSHFLPAQASVHEKYKNSSDILNCYYSNKLDSWLAEMRDTVWVHGHTHESMDYVLGETRVVCNPYGYHEYTTNPHYNHNIVIEV